MSLKDVMSSELHEQLGMYRRGALSIFQGLRSGGMSNEEAATRLIRLYNSSFAWKIEYCGYGVAHPCHVFVSRLLRSAKILMGEDWVNDHL